MSRLLGLAALAATVGILVAPAVGAPDVARCRPTPTDAFGPFGRGTPPVRAKIGTGHLLTGVVLSSLDCRPLAGARIELWQSNRNGVYTRSTSASVIADRAGRFRFEGPYPPSYEGRPPHIHIRVFARAHEALLTRFVPAPRERTGSVRLVLRPADV
jgi:protocatechuate 3,4-dioxygenase beta subunit